MANDSVKLSKNLLRMKASEAVFANKWENLAVVYIGYRMLAAQRHAEPQSEITQWFIFCLGENDNWWQMSNQIIFI